MASKRRSYCPYKRYCCVYGCLNKRKNKDTELTFFKIPDDIERRHEWLRAIDREDLLEENNSKKAKNNFVCSAHFDDSAIVTTILKRLKSDAAPTKSLPKKSKPSTHTDARDVIIKPKDTSTQALPKTSNPPSIHLLKSTKNDKPQTDTQEEK